MYAGVMAFICLLSCASVPVERRGASQLLIVSRVYPVDLETLRDSIANRFGDARSSLRSPFRSMRVIELKPPNYTADWLSTSVDPGGFLESYKRLAAPLRVHDLLIEEPTGDLYWPSEYSTAVGALRSAADSSCTLPGSLH